MIKIPTYSICNLLGANQCARDILVVDLKSFIASHQNIEFPHRHSFYQLVYFTNSGGSHTIDFQNFEAVQGQVYHMMPSQVHSWDFSEETQGIIINFSDTFFASVCHNPYYIAEFPIFKSVGGVPATFFDEKEQNSIENLFKKLLVEYECENAYKQDIMRAILTELLVEISRKNLPKNIEHISKHHLTILGQFEKLIELNFLYKRLPKEYAEMLFITPNHLNSVVSATTGRSAGELIRDRIILEAKRMLVNSDQNINEIAYQLQFEDNAYFSRFFKKYTSFSPEVFRTSYKTA